MKEEVPAIESKTNEPAQLLAELQKELADLDRQWILEQEKYKVENRGHKFIPEPGSGTTFANFMTFFSVTHSIIVAGVMGTFAHPNINTIWPPLIGAMLFVNGLFIGQDMNDKAEAYVVAKEKYQLCRATIEEKIQDAN